VTAGSWHGPGARTRARSASGSFVRVWRVRPVAVTGRARHRAAADARRCVRQGWSTTRPAGWPGSAIWPLPRWPAGTAAAGACPRAGRPRRRPHLGFNGTEIARAGRWLPPLVEAFRTGGEPPPLPWAPEGRAEYNRAAFLNLLGTRWLSATAEVDRRLRRQPPARVTDLARGAGWSSIAMAQAYSLIQVDGFDLDADVIAAVAGIAPQQGDCRNTKLTRCLRGCSRDLATLDPAAGDARTLRHRR
jgi:hypothetical protein